MLANQDLWRRALVIACGQGVVSLFVAIDVVLVAMLPGDRALAASYQASATLARVPFYIAGAVAMAFFPSLSRRASGGVIAAQAVRMYAVVALPVAVVMATTPAPVLAGLFPHQYGAVATLLKYTAVTGLAAGGISLITAFFQAADDSSCVRWLLVGLAGYVLALLTGWQLDGIPRARRGRCARVRGCADAVHRLPGTQRGTRRARVGPAGRALGRGRDSGGAPALAAGVARGGGGGRATGRSALHPARSAARPRAALGGPHTPGRREPVGRLRADRYGVAARGAQGW